MASFCIELSRKQGTMNAAQQQRKRRMVLAAKDEKEALDLATAEEKRTGMHRYFEIERVRKI